MTKKECAIIMAHTGICMLAEDDFDVFYEYVEEIMQRPVFTHELARESVVEEIRKRSKTDFIKLCENAV